MLRDTQLWVIGVLPLELAVRAPLVPMQAVFGMFNGLCCKQPAGLMLSHLCIRSVDPSAVMDVKQQQASAWWMRNLELGNCIRAIVHMRGQRSAEPAPPFVN